MLPFVIVTDAKVEYIFLGTLSSKLSRTVCSFGNPKFPFDLLVGMGLKVVGETSGAALLWPRRRFKMKLEPSLDPGADPGVTQQVEGVGVSGVAVPTPPSSCPAESSEPGLCGRVCVCYLRLLAVWVVCVLHVCVSPQAAGHWLQPSPASLIASLSLHWGSLFPQEKEHYITFGDKE